MTVTDIAPEAATVEAWLAAWQDAASAEELAGLFNDGAEWRDYLAFGDTLQTVSGAADIADLAVNRRAQSIAVERGLSPTEALFTFETSAGTG